MWAAEAGAAAELGESDRLPITSSRMDHLWDALSHAYDVLGFGQAAGKRHNAALICLARRRIDVVFAMLRDRTLYQHPPKKDLGNS